MCLSGDLLGYLAETCTIRCLRLSELEKPHLLWFHGERRIQRLKKIWNDKAGLLFKTYSSMLGVACPSLLWEVNTERNWHPESLKSSHHFSLWARPYNGSWSHWFGETKMHWELLDPAAAWTSESPKLWEMSNCCLSLSVYGIVLQQLKLTMTRTIIADEMATGATGGECGLIGAGS